MAVEMQRKTKRVHYKRAVHRGDTTLQTYLSSALEEVAKPYQRQEPITHADDSPVRLISSFRHQDGMLFGQLFLYLPGRDQTLFTLDEDADEFEIEQVALQAQNDERRQEVLDSVLYFGCLDDHLVILQSQSLGSRALENHLAWLFNERTATLDGDVAIYLSNEPSEEAKEQIRSNPPKTISLGHELETELEHDPRDYGEAHQPQQVTYRPIGRGADLLAAALGPEWRERVHLSDSLDDANIQVRLNITYLRKTTENGQRVLENIAQAFRHSEPEDVEIGLKGGGRIRGEDIQLSGDVRVDTVNGVVSASDLYERMRSWIDNMMQQDKIA